MNIVRLLILPCLLSLIFVCNGSAEIESWVDQDGVRHFSNVDTSQKSAVVKSVEEFKSSEEGKKPEPKKKKWKSYEEICRADPSCNEEMEKRKRYREYQESKERWRLKRDQELREKAERKKAQDCERYRREFEKFRQAGWDKYYPPKYVPIKCPDRTWMDSRGNVYDNRAECYSRRRVIRKAAYEKELRRRELLMKKSCGS